MAYINGRKILFSTKLNGVLHADGSVTTAMLADGAVTEDKLSAEVQAKLNAGGGGDEPTMLIIDDTNTTYTLTDTTLLLTAISNSVMPYALFENGKI